VKLISFETIFSIVSLETAFFCFVDNETKRFLEFFVLFFDLEWFKFKSHVRNSCLYRKHKFFCRQDCCSDDKINVRMWNNVFNVFVANKIVFDVHFVRCF
jgi:hypothetical protein